MNKYIENKTVEEQLAQIANILLINGTLTECPGLVHGKTGVAIFFFHYARYTENMLFADYAFDLIGLIQNQIHVNSSADYERGISGIGIGINYLVVNGFLIAEDDICIDLDQRMFRAVMSDPWLDYSLYSGLAGYGRYWISRLNSQVSILHARECLSRIVEFIDENFFDIPFDDRIDVYCFLFDLHRFSGFESCQKLLLQLKLYEHEKSFLRLGNSTLGNFIRKLQYDQFFNKSNQIKIYKYLNRIPNLNFEEPPTSMGLLSGYSGEGLLRLEFISRTNNSWMFLL
ncbi:MAG: hypothetical protein ACK5HZ_06725 [Macellibacteroides fermentans]|uniref:hypothetical protein n=1 Tax=Macellibacteroides fermentans TaxID=879969 RepID=UPI003AD7DBD2